MQQQEDSLHASSTIHHAADTDTEGADRHESSRSNVSVEGSVQAASDQVQAAPGLDSGLRVSTRFGDLQERCHSVPRTLNLRQLNLKG